MPRTAVCVFCAFLASVVAALLLLAPSSLAAEEAEWPSAATMGGELEAGAAPLKLDLTLKLLGTDTPLTEFKLLLLAKFEGLPHETATLLTDGAGKIAVTLHRSPDELRAFAFGDFTIPDGWSNVPVATLSFTEPKAWTMYARPLKRVRVSGSISVPELNITPVRANVSFAPLDVAQDGSTRLFDAPLTTLTDEQGNYELEIPVGFYKVWSYWTDRRSYDWVGYIKVQDQAAVFGDTIVNLALERGPRLRGTVIDARSGEPIPASIDIYTNTYLRQLRNATADGRLPDGYDADDNPIYRPIGTFDFQAWMVDPNNFTVVIKPQGSESVLRVFPDRSAKDFEQEVTWELYTEEMRAVEVSVSTREPRLPLKGLDVRVVPRRLEVPEHIQASYTASAMTDRDGVARFLGLAPGLYEIFGASGTSLLGELTVTNDLRQSHETTFAIPFVYGSVKLPDSSVCRNLTVFVSMTNQGGREFGPFPSDAFKDNPALQERGTVFVPLLSFGSRFRLRFAAMEGGREYSEDEWIRMRHFPLITDEVEIVVDDEKGWEVELTLKPNPEYEKYERR